MTLPTFLGIGVPKAGTTWLHELLDTHPDVYTPTKAKDVRYFNHHYELGTDWYQGFFPPDDEAANYKAIGEFTRHYLYCEECPQRISEVLERPKLLLMLRNPIERTWSHYKHRARLSNYDGSFEQFFEDYPGSVGFGSYAEHIRRYQTYFEQAQMLIMLFDQVFSNIELTRDKVAEFLEIDPLRFPENAGEQVVNKGYIPRYRSVYAMINKGSWLAQSKQLYWPVTLAKKMGVKRLISMQGDQQSMRMSVEARQKSLEVFGQEISDLETVLQTDLSHWKS